MEIKFEKWHANGNDFVIVNNIDAKIKITKKFIKKISDRNKGIGFDQLIQVDLPTNEDHDFFIKFAYNPISPGFNKMFFAYFHKTLKSKY